LKRPASGSRLREVDELNSIVDTLYFQIISRVHLGPGFFLNQRKFTMKTKLVLALLTAGITLASTAAFGQKLYPIQGPLASQTPPPVFSGKIRRPMFSAGGLPVLLKSWTVANGEVLNGKCSEVKATSLNTKTPGAPDSYPPQPNLAFAWDAVYGKGYFAAHVLGNKMWQGTFTGDKGTVLQVEILDREHGAAVDNKGNVYKEVWQ
jgi:hypothetical protein